MRSGPLALACLLVTAFGCSPPRRGGPGDGGGGGFTGDLAQQPPIDAALAVVYAHSDSFLYQIDPDTLALTPIGPFGWPNGGDQMTDIAIDKGGHMVGVSFDSVYSVDPMTAKCTYLAPLDRSFNGLSFVPANLVDSSNQEVLVAAAIDGSFYKLDPTTGASTPIGNYGGGIGSSGDVVSVTNFGTVATVTRPGSSTDWLATIDPATGVATPLADTHVSGIWGLGFWKGKVFGFTDSNQFVLIDPKTGATQVVQTGNVSWWGAGVTTSAPPIP